MSTVAAVSDARVVFVTAPSEAVALDLARALVSERLAACSNLIPGVRSVYRWKGEICDDAEVLLVFKTRAALVDRLAARVAALHPYEVPEVVALPVSSGLPAYLSWIVDSVSNDRVSNDSVSEPVSVD